MTQAALAGAREVVSGQSVSFFEIRRQGWTPSNEQSGVDGIRRRRGR
ncbi:MAG: hypothetical protein V5A34_04975 [Halapricum sp.]